MQAIDIPLLSGIIPVLTLIVAEVMMSYLSLKSKNIRKFLSGEPSIVVYDGCINEAELKNFGLISMICLRNFALTVVTIYPMAVAVLETSGKLSVIPKDKARPVTVEDLQLENVRHDGLPCVIVSDGTLNEG